MTRELTAPVAGKVIKIHVSPGSKIEEDEEVFVIEALKMETPVYAPGSGTVREIKVKQGDPVEEDDVLAVIE